MTKIRIYGRGADLSLGAHVADNGRAVSGISCYSANRLALATITSAAPATRCDDLLARMAPVDIVLLDGFRRSSYPKPEVVPPGQDKPLLAPGDPMVLAITSDLPVVADVPCPARSNFGALADFVAANAQARGNTQASGSAAYFTELPA